MEQHTFIAKTAHGLEEVLATEIKNIGASVSKIGKRVVEFQGDVAMMYKANLHLRTAFRILLPIHVFTATNAEQLYTQVKSIVWDKHIQLNQTFAIDKTIYSEYFTHSHYAGLKMKDAICDWFVDKYEQRPSIQTKTPDIQLHLHISKDKCTILLDSSGDSLHKRGYRLAQNEAPISEVLAAGMILLSEWDTKSLFIDPMCGSGTFPIEASMLATNTAPGLLRERFGFQNWQTYDESLWLKLKQKAQEAILETEAIILGSDTDRRSINFSRRNASAAQQDELILSTKNFFTPRSFGNQKGIIMMNPPYGERIGPYNIKDYYKKIGDTLKKHYAGFTAYIISSNQDAIKSIGLRPSKKTILYNGSLECKFLKFELYDGSRKKKKLILKK